MTETNKLTDVLENALSVFFEDIHTCMPGRIESYDFKSQKASVKPLLKKEYLDGEVLDLKVIGNVPVIFPRTKHAGITFPVEKGDGCLLLFSERAIERWKLSGNNSSPGDHRRYSLSDAICLVGLFSLNSKNIASNNDDTQIHNNGQTITIKKNGDIDVGGSSLLKLVNETFLSIFDSHTHVYAPGPGSPIPTGPPVPISSSVNLTSKVKAQ